MANYLMGREQLEWLINTEADLADLPSDESSYGSTAHTPGYDKVWELGPTGWVEV